MKKKKRQRRAAGRSNSAAASGGMLLTENSPFAVKEAYIKLRTNLMFCMTKNKEQNCRVFAVTSANKDEGKSVSAANIAISFAMLGKKTLLIDADLRKSTQQKMWGLQEANGLCDLLAGLGTCGKYQVNSMPLTLICAGTMSPNPAELLASQKMTALVAHLRNQYDYIIIDTPPVNVVADAQIISAYVDGFVVVARSGKTESRELVCAVDTLRRADGNLCGVLLNRLDPRVGKYAYGYRTGGYYGYSDYGGK